MKARLTRATSETSMSILTFLFSPMSSKEQLRPLHGVQYRLSTSLLKELWLEEIQSVGI